MSYANTDSVNLDLLDDLDAAFEGGGTVSAFNADTEPGTVVSGIVLSVIMRQARDFHTGDPATWPDGKPKREVVVTIETEHGERNVYIQTWGRAKQRLSAGIGAAGLTKISQGLRPGNTLSVRFNGKKEAVSKRGDTYSYRDYEYGFVPATPAPSVDPAFAPPH
ncbi:hypothetical protein [Gordonia alkaliphila]|uniref:Single-stranded DNA-binding protein n=1 Tax=Gordonia alkaliphila TaxID=1053547 RepID=A0ABP8YWV2_9ACTN